MGKGDGLMAFKEENSADILEALKARVRAAEETLREATAALNAEIAARSTRKVGDKLTTSRGKKFVISRISAAYGKPVYFGRQILKSGECGAVERRLYDWDFR